MSRHLVYILPLTSLPKRKPNKKNQKRKKVKNYLADIFIFLYNLVSKIKMDHYFKNNLGFELKLKYFDHNIIFLKLMLRYIQKN